MKLITATKSPLRCRGFDGRHHPIFTKFEYVKLRRGKFLCKACRDKIEPDECEIFWQSILNKFKG